MAPVQTCAGLIVLQEAQRFRFSRSRSENPAETEGWLIGKTIAQTYAPGREEEEGDGRGSSMEVSEEFDPRPAGRV